MNKRPSIYLGSSLEELLKELKGEEGKVSTIINDIADKYKVIVEECKPELTRDEWLSMCAVYNGHFFGPDIIHKLRAMDWQASEWIKYSPGEAGQFDTTNLVEKIRALTIPERVSVLHSIAKFWNNPDHDWQEW
jgi:hypothetical protein